MKQNKSKKILIICIIVILILILIAGLAFAFIATDIFKSKKELFFKYSSQLMNNESGFIDSNISTYFEKQKVTPYEDEGIIRAEITNNDLQDKLEYINDFNISYTGKVDIANSKSKQAISINYSDDVYFPINYRQSGNILGLQTKYIGSKYMAIKSDDIEGLLSKIGINLNISTQNIARDFLFSEEELDQLKNTYTNVINQQLKDEFFTKITTSNATGYKLNLKGQDLKNIIITILETMKTDEMLLRKLNDYISLQNNSVEFNESTIDEIINNINENTEFEQNNVEIAVYQNNEKLNQITIQVNEDVKIDINKSAGNDEVYYNFVVTTYKDNLETQKIYFNAKYTGLQTMETISENYEIGFQDSGGIIYRAKHAKNKSSIEREKEIINFLIIDIKSNKILSDDENLTITDIDIEQALNSDTQDDYSKIKLLKIDDTKFSITFTDTGNKFIIDNTGKIIEEPEIEENENTENNQKLEYKYIYNNKVNFINEVIIEEFNEDNSMILNDQSSEYLVNLFGAIGERLHKVNKSQMEEIGLNENENPMIYLIPSLGIYNSASNAILKSQESLDETAISTFNTKFEMYASKNSKGATTKGLLSTILMNNTSEDAFAKIKEINFDGQEYEVTEQNITLIKSNINTEDLYKVEFEKDGETGLIYRVVINKV